MRKYKKIYVLAPFGHSTGGVELAHQLVDYLRNKDLEAYIVYVAKGDKVISDDQAITANYSKYNLKSTDVIEDSSDNILVLPEIYFEFILNYKEIKIACWWMSVDFRYTRTTFSEMFKFKKSTQAKWGLVKAYLKGYCRNFKNDDNLLKKESARIIHLYQSHYAQYFLYSKGFSRLLPLSDYINLELVGNVDAPVIDQSKCVNCALCQKCCPVLHTDRFDPNSLKDLKVYEAWSLDDDVRQISSSGGVFGQLAHNVLRDGGVVVGVAFDGKKAFHTVIDKVEDLHRVQDTKYVQSHAHGAYRATLQNLRVGKKVIFSGTPCQVAACKSYLLNKKYSGQLLTMEVVCHGVPTYLALNQSLSYIGASRVISFRDKTNGWGYHSQHMCYESQDGNLIYKNREDDVFYRMFFCEKLLRNSCYSCPFAHLPRIADITIGDSWGTSNSNREEQFKGLSLLLINNPTGEQWSIKSICMKDWTTFLTQSTIYTFTLINDRGYEPILI
jgi:coenzyme F420-reducing hydrogenase beta subunit